MKMKNIVLSIEALLLFAVAKGVAAETRATVAVAYVTRGGVRCDSRGKAAWTVDNGEIALTIT